MFGWSGRTIIVDLSSHSVTESRTGVKQAREYLGGRGFGIKLMHDFADPGVDPLSSDNPLVFATGPITGTMAPMSGHYSIITKSPLTHTIFDSNAGGHFGKAMKYAGIDALVITGSSDIPIYLSIFDEDVELISAEHLWGKDVRETTLALKDKGSVACIGRAGEKKVRFANFVNDDLYSSGRGGHGAVAGSKNLKAIVVKGTNDPLIAEPRSFEKAITSAQRLLLANPVTSKGLSVYGTSFMINVMDHLDILPSLNFRERGFHHGDNISAEKLSATYKGKSMPCDNCPLGCIRLLENGSLLPDYDALWAFGPAVDNVDMESIIKANDLCYVNGVDPISCGATIASYLEMSGEKIDHARLLQTVSDVSQGISSLSEGSLSYMITQGAKELSMSSKGLEMPGYDPRDISGFALAYATSNRGACHMSAFMAGPELLGKPVVLDRFVLQGKAGFVKLLQDLAAVIDSIVLCPFVSFALGEGEIASLVSAATGVSYSSEDLLRVGERIWNLERLFNLRAGFTHEDDALPERMFSNGGISEEDLKKAISEYYQLRGWDNLGVPTTSKLEQLGIVF
ncbi:MAG: aldehyde ferredoxin oxidoreductase family protein [Methanomethylovorans sp.]|uniref:aldehyde ferredoxin oxidoreductase family protein n=1 Tax=Methanomethylovorans sp. TaxID=2758717 RepID=UPI003C71AD80